MMKTLVLRSFFIWVLSSVLIHAMVIPVDFSTGDFSFSIDNVTVIDSAVDVAVIRSRFPAIMLTNI